MSNYRVQTSKVELYEKLGILRMNQREKEEALRYYEDALKIAIEIGDRGREARMLSHLGLVYDSLGKKEEALGRYNAALVIFKERNDASGEAQMLCKLAALCYSRILLGLPSSKTISRTVEEAIQKEVIQRYEEALPLFKQVGDLRGESSIVNSLGSIYDRLGQREQARGYLMQAHDLYKRIEEPEWQGIAYYNIGVHYSSERLDVALASFDVALASFLCANEIFERTGSPHSKETSRWIDDLERKMGKKQFSASKAKVQPRAATIVEQALHENK